jgi:putative transposase
MSRYRLTPTHTQLTEARDANPWLADGSVVVQQQALRDFRHAMANFFAGTHRMPTWRKAGRDQGFRIVAVKPEHVRRLNRHAAAVLVPKAGWVRFRLSRPVPAGPGRQVLPHQPGRGWPVAYRVRRHPGTGTGPR